MLKYFAAHEKWLGPTLSLLFAFLSLSLLVFVYPHFTFNIRGSCDSWFYFATTYAWQWTHQLPEYFYYNDRLPATLPKAFLNFFVPFPAGRYLYVFLVHFVALEGIRRVFSLLANVNVGLFSLCLFALNPLLLGSLHTDYIAMEAFVYALWSLVLLLIAERSVGQKRSLFLILVGAAYCLSFFSHFRILLYSIFVPLFVILSADRGKWFRSDMFSRLWRFGLGFLLMTCLISLIYVFHAKSSAFFFKDSLRIVFMDESDFRRSWQDILTYSPVPYIFSICLALYLRLLWLGRTLRLASLVMVVPMVKLVIAVSGGNLFVESNYVWGLLPVLVLLALNSKEFFSAIPSPLLPILVLLIGVWALYLPDHTFSQWIFSIAGNWGFIWVFIFCTGFFYLFDRLKSFTRVRPLQWILVTLFLLNWNLNRPDREYGLELFKKETFSWANVESFETVIQFIQYIRLLYPNNTPVIVSEEINDFVAKNMQSTMVQCGPGYRSTLGHLTPRHSQWFKIGRDVIYISTNEHLPGVIEAWAKFGWKFREMSRYKLDPYILYWAEIKPLEMSQ